MKDKVVSFESNEEFFAHIKKLSEMSRLEGLEVLKQGWGKFFVNGTKFYYEVQGLVIWGEVEDSPYEEDREMAKTTPWLRLARCYSQWCPEGELGMVHLAHIRSVVSDEIFEEAKALGWTGNLKALGL